MTNYDPVDPQQRLNFFYEAYQEVPFIPKPASLNDDDEYDEPDNVVPDEQFWLQNAAYHASLALNDALAGLIELLNEDLLEQEADDEGVVYDDEA